MKTTKYVVTCPNPACVINSTFGGRYVTDDADDFYICKDCQIHPTIVDVAN